MQYYQISFNYRGPYDGYCVSKAANRALSAAYDEADELLGLLRLRRKHAYSWPDGSLYFFVKTPLPQWELQVALDRRLRAFEPKHITAIEQIYIESPTKDPQKAYHRTLRSYLSLRGVRQRVPEKKTWLRKKIRSRSH
jgi:hypothetical protein